jgi:hypothetical protein
MNKNNKTLAIIVGIFLTNALTANPLQRKNILGNTLTVHSFLYSATQESKTGIEDRITQLQQELSQLLTPEEKILITVSYVAKKNCAHCTSIVTEAATKCTIIPCDLHCQLKKLKSSNI